MGMFDTAKPVQAAKKPKSKFRDEFPVAGVEHLAMIDALQKTLETLRGTIEAEVKAVAFERFTAHIAETGQRPESFRATDGGAAATMTLSRIRKTTALTEPVVEMLREHGVEPEKEVVTPELYAINPAYAGDKALLGKVEKALKKIVPDDFIVLQEEVSKFVSTEETFALALSKRIPAEVLKQITYVSASPKLQETNLASILDFVRGLIDAPAFGSAAAEAKASTLQLVKAA